MKRLEIIFLLFISLVGCANQQIHPIEKEEELTEEEMAIIEEEEMVKSIYSEITKEIFYEEISKNENLKHKEEKLYDNQTDFLFVSKKEKYKISYCTEPSESPFLVAIEIDRIKITDEFLETMEEIFELLGGEFDPESIKEALEGKPAAKTYTSGSINFYQPAEDCLRITFN